jgi:uncharacterized protein YjiS (DUF1127 family)
MLQIQSEHFHPIDESQQQIANAGSVCLSPLRASLAWFRASWLPRRKRGREIRQLQAFSDSELKDIGLSRSDLCAIGNGTYRRD